ncbi:tRNA 2-thiocytidine biosynthesis protein ttca, partial [Globisporangium splendens]
MPPEKRYSGPKVGIGMPRRSDKLQTRIRIAGTLDILGNIRLGLAFQVKQRVGTQAILDLEKMNLFRVSGSLANNDNVVLLGRGDIEKLPIFSFLVRFGDRFLHYNFVCALLNDLFGIQTRGGCQCAGPYAARLLGIVESDLVQFKTALSDHQEALKPGFTRMSFPYFMDASEVDYILRAVHFVANEGWKFLPQYRFDAKAGSWKHISRVTRVETLKTSDQFALALDSSRGDKSTTAQDDTLDASGGVDAHRGANLTTARWLADQSSEHALSLARSQHTPQCSNLWT